MKSGRHESSVPLCVDAKPTVGHVPLPNLPGASRRRVSYRSRASFLRPHLVPFFPSGGRGPRKNVTARRGVEVNAKTFRFASVSSPGMREKGLARSSEWLSLSLDRRNIMTVDNEKVAFTSRRAAVTRAGRDGSCGACMGRSSINLRPSDRLHNAAISMIFRTGDFSLMPSS